MLFQLGNKYTLIPKGVAAFDLNLRLFFFHNNPYDFSLLHCFQFLALSFGSFLSFPLRTRVCKYVFVSCACKRTFVVLIFGVFIYVRVELKCTYYIL